MESLITFLNTTGKSFISFSGTMLIQSSMLIIVLLVLNIFLRKKVRVVLLYSIWMLVLVKLVLPTTLSSPLGLGYWIGDKVPRVVTEKASYAHKQIVSILQRSKPVNETMPYAFLTTDLPPVGTSPEFIADTSADFTVVASPTKAFLSWQGFVFLGWLAGVISMAVLLIRRMFVVRDLLAQSKNPNDSMVNIFERCRKQMGIKRPISLELSPVAVSPSACGLFRPKILIPQNLIRKLKPDDLKSVILHELAHIKRGDLWVSCIQTILQIAYFYNPLLWMANVIIRKVREEAVDEMVLVAMGEKAEDYPQTLLNVSRMTFGRPVLTLRLIGVVEPKKALERRIMIMLNRPVPKSSKLGIYGLFAIVVIGTVILPMGYNPAWQTAFAASRITDKAIVPGARVGEYTFNMTEDDILERLGKPNAIFYGNKRYTLDNLPRHYYMSFGDISFRIHNDLVKEITALSPEYKFANGLGVGDSEQKIKQAFGDDFQLKETQWKDFLSYKDKGLVFEINKQDRTVMEINVSPLETSKSYSAADIVRRIIIPGHRVGGFTFNMTEDDVLEALGRPKRIFYGDREYTFDNLPRKYFMHYGDLSFHIVDKKVKGITVLSPSYKFPNGIKVGDSEQKVKKAFGEDFHIEKHRVKDFLYYKDENLMFEISKSDRKVMEINVSPCPASGLYRKADIPSTTYINEKGRLVDKVDYPFVDDPKVVGGWKTVDFVREIKDFDPHEKNWGGKLWLNHLIFEEDGTMHGTKSTWTKGLVLSDDTASKYILKEIDGSAYMFYEWKSGDYTIRYMKPFYYVLKKVSLDKVKHEPMYGEKVDIPETSYINDQGHIVDKIDFPFVNDPQLIGTWESVDFVSEIEEFNPQEKKWKGGELYLKGLIFKPDGETFKPWWTWTKGLIFHSGDKTASKYTIKRIDDSTYMFYEWKSGDYTIRHRKPAYYVLKKISSETSGPLDEIWISKQEDEVSVDEKAHIPPTSYINEQGHIVDKIDYPFVDDPQVIGTWESVDFVDEIRQFKVGEQQWKGRGGELFLNEMMFKRDGRLTCKNDKVPNGYGRTWTKGLVISDNDTKTASKYIIKEIDGSTYIFYEWKSGDYTFRHRKPSYYVLKKISS